MGTWTYKSDKAYVKLASKDTLSGLVKLWNDGSSTSKAYRLKDHNKVKDYSKTTVDKVCQLNGITNKNKVSKGQTVYFYKSTSGSSTSSNMAKIIAAGPLTDDENTAYALWSWGKSNTDHYKIRWDYKTRDGHWWTGENEEIKKKESTFSIPEVAVAVRFRVQPIAKKHKVKGKNVAYWTAKVNQSEAIDTKEHLLGDAPQPAIEYNSGTDEMTILATVDATSPATKVEFTLYYRSSEESTSLTTVYTASAKIVGGIARLSVPETAVVHSKIYSARCALMEGSSKTDMGPWSDQVYTKIDPPSKWNSVSAKTKDSIQLSWQKVNLADGYRIQYTTNQEYFDSQTSGGNVSTVDTRDPDTDELVNVDSWIIAGMEIGQTYYFRIASIRGNSISDYSTDIAIASTGKRPNPPTTWSSTTKAKVNGRVILYWVHNSVDGSSQTAADIRLVIDNSELVVHDINTTDEDLRDENRYIVLSLLSDGLVIYNKEGTELPYSGDPIPIRNGSSITWSVSTYGAVTSLSYASNPSVERIVDVYSSPTIVVDLVKDGESITEVTSFPFDVVLESGPQNAIGYQVEIYSQSNYTTVGDVGNEVSVVPGTRIYNRYFDVRGNQYIITMTPDVLDLQNGSEYMLRAVVVTDVGMTTEMPITFRVAFDTVDLTPEIEFPEEFFSTDDYTAQLMVKCETEDFVYYAATQNGSDWVMGDRIPAPASDGVAVEGAVISYEEEELTVYSYFEEDNDTDIPSYYYCRTAEDVPVEGVLLSLYRREFDGSFVCLGKNLANYTTVTDPHPALDYARYRVVAEDQATGSISFYDPPARPTQEKAIIIQWDEAWTEFSTDDAVIGFSEETEDIPAEPAWSGSLLRLPYNVDVSDNHAPDAALTKYIGRTRPVSYYGTQLDHSSVWNTVIPKDDIDTLYAIRRLSNWRGDVYVREPSGSGYWASIKVSYSQKHRELTIPITFNVTRVEGHSEEATIKLDSETES